MLEMIQQHSKVAQSAPVSGSDQPFVKPLELLQRVVVDAQRTSPILVSEGNPSPEYSRQLVLQCLDFWTQAS
jgi:hypothetical protein